MWLFLGSFGASLIVGIPIALALGLASFSYLLITGNTQLLLAFPQRMVAGIDQFVLLAIPLFLLAGNLMNAGGVTHEIIRFAQSLVGKLRGGLAYVTVVSSTMFSGVSGSATAEASALGTVMIPAMKRDGYKVEYSAALVATSSILGPMIPPSIGLIIYGVLSSTSIGALFVAGIFPGLILAACLMGYVCYVARREDHPASPQLPWPEKMSAALKALPALLLPVIIIGGIRFGAFTPTEAAAVAVAYVVIISLIFYRSLTSGAFTQALYRTATATSGIMLIVAMASMASFVLGIEAVPQRVAQAMLSVSDNPVVLLLLINLLLLLLGLFLEPLAAMILVLPILLQIIPIIGVDPVQFGIIVVLNLMIGMVTPPVGLCLFIVCAIARVPLERVSWQALPMLGICLFVLGLVTFVPQITLWLPRVLGG